MDGPTDKFNRPPPSIAEQERQDILFIGGVALVGLIALMTLTVTYVAHSFIGS